LPEGRLDPENGTVLRLRLGEGDAGCLRHDLNAIPLQPELEGIDRASKGGRTHDQDDLSL
jgi:hypothetical protein